jgi:ABC-type phosphate transport system substrate-binding protein
MGIHCANAFDGVVIVDDSTPATSLKADELKNILTGKTKYWENGTAIVIVYVDQKAEKELQSACGMNSSAFKTFWQRLAFSGRGQQPKKADDVPAAVALVKANKGSIAVVTADADITGVKKVEIK